MDTGDVLNKYIKGRGARLIFNRILRIYFQMSVFFYEPSYGFDRLLREAFDARRSDCETAQAVRRGADAGQLLSPR